MKHRTVTVMICVNNPDNGMYCGHCAGIHISDFIQIEPAVMPEPKITMHKDAFWIHRRRFKVLSHQTWVGNWCWDAITLALDDAAELIANVLKQRWKSPKNPDGIPVWHIDQADGDRCIAFMDRFNQGDVPTAQEWAGALRAMMAEVQS